ncbi:hypothetical protein FNV43_RR03624 [Rhamnella rubrinervis]|uniref:Zinc knuckle CX2CX4HX4C domain-containing protein n=1 Tax=Rhamnella rubrinervis TaxID=2594499 RepID=A0A8K0MNV2_9ROSA|nr:hypothetical protein FNV43_RR03624 [Rhamnella rubrinervis]
MGIFPNHRSHQALLKKKKEDYRLWLYSEDDKGREGHEPYGRLSKGAPKEGIEEEADGALDKARKHKKRQLEDTLNLVLKKRKILSCINETIHGNYASTSPKSGLKFIEFPETRTLDFAERMKLLDAQRSLHLHLKPDVSKLCEILQFSKSFVSRAHQKYFYLGLIFVVFILGQALWVQLDISGEFHNGARFREVAEGELCLRGCRGFEVRSSLDRAAWVVTLRIAWTLGDPLTCCGLAWLHCFVVTVFCVAWRSGLICRIMTFDPGWERGGLKPSPTGNLDMKLVNSLNAGSTTLEKSFGIAGGGVEAFFSKDCASKQSFFIDVVNGNYGHFARVLIDVDLAGFVPEKLLLETTDDGIEVELYFESFLDFYTFCHSIGHSVAECKSVIGKVPLKDGSHVNEKENKTLVLNHVYKSSGNELEDDDYADDFSEDEWPPLQGEGFSKPSNEFDDTSCRGQQSNTMAMVPFESSSALTVAQRNLNFVASQLNVSEITDQNL